MDYSKLTRPVWAEINLDHLANNIQEVRRITKKEALVTAVIKADGYGHGAKEIAQTLLENGADRFAVATLSEAIQLKKSFAKVPTMILGYTPSASSDQVVKYDIIQTVYSYDQAEAFNQSAIDQNKIVKLHIKLDTGMRRLGMEISEETVQQIKKIHQLSNVEIEGIFTHFAVADEKNKDFTKEQVSRYNEVVQKLENEGIIIPIKHVSNSAAIIDLPELNYNMVRAGIVLYGLYPSDDVCKKRLNLKEVMSLKAQISHVKTIDEGEGISYGLKFVADKSMDVATLPIGYADGFTRLYTHKALGIVSGMRRPIVGRICMDQCMIDVTGMKVKVGDAVCLFGNQDDQIISIDEYARFIDTINYEVVCMISKRVPRVYTKCNEIIFVKDWMLMD